MPQGQQLPVHALGRALVELMKVLLQRIRRACPSLTTTCRLKTRQQQQQQQRIREVGALLPHVMPLYMYILKHESAVSRIQSCRNEFIKPLLRHTGIHGLFLNVAMLLCQFRHTTCT